MYRIIFNYHKLSQITYILNNYILIRNYTWLKPGNSANVIILYYNILMFNYLKFIKTYTCISFFPFHLFNNLYMYIYLVCASSMNIDK